MKKYLGLGALLALSALIAVPALAGKDDKKAEAAKSEPAKAEPAKGDAAKAPEKKADDSKPCVGPDGKPCAPECCAGAPTAALAQMQATAGNKVKGTVKFVEGADGKVTVTAELEGLNPGQQHAFHVHEFGDCSAPDGASAGGHYNPGGHDHGLPEKAPQRHAGDLGNLTADKDGKAKYTVVVDNLTVGKKFAVIGRSVIVHAKTDDGGQPTGNAGGRVACGLIGVAKP